MSCCGNGNTKIQPLKDGQVQHDLEDDFDGPLKKRSCRDVPFCIILLGLLGGMAYVGYLGYMYGDPDRLIYGVDSWGNTCNKPNEPIANISDSGRDMTGLKNLYYFSMTATGFATNKPKICVKECPTQELQQAEDVEAFATVNNSYLCHYDVLPADYTSKFNSLSEDCPILPIQKTYPVLHKCLPETLLDIAKGLLSSIGNILNTIDTNFTEKFVSDVERTWIKILYLCAIGFGAALFMVILMRFAACILIWTMVFVLAIGSLGGTGFLWYLWYEKKYVHEMDETTVRNWTIYAGVATGVTVIILFILLIMRKRIQLVVQLFKEAGKAIGKMPLLLLQPLWTLIILTGVVGGMGYVFLYLLTAKHPTVDYSTGFVSYEDDKVLFYLKWFYVFGFLWLTQFVVACHEIVIAGAIATWFFTRNKKKLGCCSPILASIGRLIRYHLGSAAFGSFIIALVKFARLILAYIQKKVAGKAGPLVDFILKCLQCCLWCFEKFLKFVNRNAYIEIAIYGYSFCKAAQKAFSLIVSNALRVAAINSVGDFVLFIGKLSTVGIVTGIGLLFFKDDEELFYIWVPLVIAGIFAFLIAHCFFTVYEMAIDTIFLCFCEDCERNDGIVKPYYMSKELMAFVENASEAIKHHKKREKQLRQNEQT
ncbi:choline transporter-like protein 1 [Tubulanus polymorphus]|uniref:choline transporter-like protein 1 n=1 Tax=Tubulanus polymorphus TaxID=672921 RepID=UPI003DA45F1A